MSSLRTAFALQSSRLATRFQHASLPDVGLLMPTSSFSSVSIPYRLGRQEEDDKRPQQQHYPKRRRYHATPRNELLLYGTMILVATLGYVGYKKYHGEPLKPSNASEAQKAYRKMEQERSERNQRKRTDVKDEP